MKRDPEFSIKFFIIKFFRKDQERSVYGGQGMFKVEMMSLEPVSWRTFCMCDSHSNSLISKLDLKSGL